MGASASLSPPEVTVEPGGQAFAELLVRNTGSVVDLFNFEVRGDADGWVTVDPPALSLFPGGEGTAHIVFAPPRAPTARAGLNTYAVRVASTEDPEGSIVEEGVVHVAPFSDAFAELLPRTSRGRRRAKHELAFDNRGNQPLQLSMSAADADDQLDIKVDPSTMLAEMGTASFAKVLIKPRKRFLRGAPQTHQFQTFIETTTDTPPMVVDGTMLQEPLIPRWLPRAILGLLLLALLLAGLWFALLKPTVESAARAAAEESAEEAATEQAAAVAEAAEQAAAAQEAAEEALAGQEAAQEAADAAGESEVAAAEERAMLADLGEPHDFRLTRSVAPGAEASTAFDVPDDQVLSLTDIVVQNPQGDRGLLQIRRGTAVLIEVRLENFRDLDYHFVSPMIFTGGQQVVLTIRCENEPPTACNAGGYFNGFVRTVEEPPEG